jgi:acetyltransferase
MVNSRGWDGVFRPRSVGASRQEGPVGREVVTKLIAGGSQGPVYPVNPKAEVVFSILAYRSVGAIKAAVDHCVLVVPPFALAGSVAGEVADIAGA